MPGLVHCGLLFFKIGHNGLMALIEIGQGRLKLFNLGGLRFDGPLALRRSALLILPTSIARPRSMTSPGEAKAAS